MPRAARLERRQQLRQQLLAKGLAAPRDEGKARVRDEATQAFGRAPLLWCDDQTAQLRRALVGETKAQQGVVEMLVERFRVAFFIEHVEIDIRSIPASELR